MFRRILVPLDGSRLAERVLPVASRLGKATAGTVILLRVVNPTWPSMTQTTFAQQLPAAARFEAEEYLLSLSKNKAWDGIHLETAVPMGPEGTTILTTATQKHADIIVLSTHGHTGISRWMLGSIADKVTSNATVPVLLIREKGALPLGPHPDPIEPLRVLVPLDGSSLALAAIEMAAELITALNTSHNNALHVTYVLDNMDRLQDAKNYLQTVTASIRQGELAQTIAQQHLPVTWSIAMNTDVADGIIRVAENGEDVENSGIFGGCDIIAMTTHGQTGLPFWTLGSITERVRTGTRLPMLIIRPPAIAEQLRRFYDVEAELATHAT